MSKPEQIFVKPCKAGAIIRDPRAPIMVLPDDGAWRPNNSFWNRRLMQGDVETSKAPVPEASQPSHKAGRKGGK